MRSNHAAAAALLSIALVSTAARAESAGGSYHMLKLDAPRPHAAAGDSSAATMLYYAGPVIAAVKVVAVIWGAGVDPATVTQIGPFLGSLVHSTYADQLTQYSTHLVGVNGKPGTQQTITRGSFLGQFAITPHNASSTLTDGQVRGELKRQVASGALPPTDLNTLYMVYFPASKSISLGGSLSCQAFGGYHEARSATVTPTNLFYAVMPNCGGGFTAQTVVTSHEFAEAVSDAIPTPGSHPKYPQAWNTHDGFEIGDLCEGFNTTLTAGTKRYTVQEVFDNKSSACATGTFTSP